jgi:hypothetical protein
MKDKETKEFGKEWQDEQREKMVRIQFPKTIQRIEQEAERRGFNKGIELEQLRNAEFFEEDYQNKERLKQLEAELKLLEEENGKQE